MTGHESHADYEALYQAIQPLRELPPANQHQNAADESLARASRRRRKAAAPRLVLFWSDALRVGCFVPLLAGSLLLGWAATSLTSLAQLLLPTLLLMVLGLMEWLRIGPERRRWGQEQWAHHYRDAYLRIAASDLPQQIVYVAEQLPQEGPSATLQLYQGDQLHSVHDLLLEHARNTDLFEEPFRHPAVLDTNWIDLPVRRFLERPFGYTAPAWNTRVRARYAALYDYFFFPQQQFHELLESTPQPARLR